MDFLAVVRGHLSVEPTSLLLVLHILLESLLVYRSHLENELFEFRAEVEPDLGKAILAVLNSASINQSVGSYSFAALRHAEFLQALLAHE
jgi:hypothetical protein